MLNPAAARLAMKYLTKKNVERAAVAASRFLQRQTLIIGGAQVIATLKKYVYKGSNGGYNTEAGTLVGALYETENGELYFTSDGENFQKVEA